MRGEFSIPDRWEPVEELFCVSGMVLLRCWREGEERLVLCKTMVQAPSASELMRFQREHQAFVRLRGPGVAEVLSYTEVAGSPALLFVDGQGQTLDTLGLRELSVEEALRVVLAVGEVLERLHGEGLVHRRVFPWHWLWSAKHERVELIDLGCCGPAQEEEEDCTFSLAQMAYISPEQTGQLDVGVDHRSDLYALGALAWMLLVGQPPFVEEEPEALVHAHLARPVPVLAELREGLPRMLVRVLEKLLAKHPKERYQSATGALADLRRCLVQVQEGATWSFRLGQEDHGHQFTLPARVVGRERELSRMAGALEAVQQARRVMLFVHGPPGIGKSTLASAMRERVVGVQGHFAMGRFSLQRQEPYHALRAALRDLFQELLTLDVSTLFYWRTRLSEALGHNGSVLVGWLPELALLLDEVMELMPLGPEEERDRISHAFLDLFGALAHPRHPFVLCLDDLQWADPATLSLMEFLFQSPHHQGFLLLGSYRDNEVHEDSGLARFLRSLAQEESGEVVDVHLGPLETPAIAGLLAEVCQAPTAEIEALAALLEEKTGGSPFFLQALLRELARVGVLWPQGHGWSWDLNKLREVEVTDNVVAWLVSSLDELAAPVRDALCYAACLGTSFRAGLLAALLGMGVEELEARLDAACDWGLLLHTSKEDGLWRAFEEDAQIASGAVYHFAHDRVQEAFVAMLSEQERARRHQALAQGLLRLHESSSSSDVSVHPEVLFAIIHQLEHGLWAEATQAQRREYAGLALLAGQQARSRAALERAWELFSWGLEVLGEQAWEQERALTLGLTSAACEVGVAIKQRQPVLALIEELKHHGQSLLEELPAWKAHLEILLGESAFQEALDITNHFVSRAGFPEIKVRSVMYTAWLFWRVHRLLAGRTPEELALSLPLLEDPLQQGVLDMYCTVAPAYQIVLPAVAGTMILQDVYYALRYGYTNANIQCWSGYASIQAGLFGRIELAERYGKLSLTLLDKFQTPPLSWIRINAAIQLVVSPWKQAISDSIVELGKISVRGQELGNLSLASLSGLLKSMLMFYEGRPLEFLQQHLRQEEVLREQYDSDGGRFGSQMVRHCLTLLCREQAPQEAELLLDEEGWEEGFLAEIYLPCAQLLMALLWGHEERAFAVALADRAILKNPVSVLFRGIFWTYAMVALHRGTARGLGSGRRRRKQLRQGMRALQIWCAQLPSQRQFRLTWIEANRLVAVGQREQAVVRFDQALEEARRAGFRQDAALIAEQAAVLCAQLGHERMVRFFRQEALDGYRQWGAVAKVAQLEKLLPVPSQTRRVQALRETPGTGLAWTLSAEMPQHDAMLAAFAALTTEEEPRLIIQQLLSLLLQRSGAGRVCLLRKQEAQWSILARQEDPQAPVEFVASALSLDDPHVSLPTTMLRYVILSFDPIVLPDASEAGPFVKDPYIQRQRPHAVLCAPLLLQNQLHGLIYLENQLTAGVFASPLGEWKRLLFAQLAVCLSLLEEEDTVAMRGSPRTPEFRLKQLARSISATPAHGAARYVTLESSAVEAAPSVAERVPVRGQYIGEWRLLREIAQGGMSVIYEAVHRTSEQHSAIKLLGHSAASASRLERFSREARILATLEHPNIVKIYDFDRDPSFGHFMALEYLEGQNFQEVLNQYAPLPLGWLYIFSEALCEALGVVHEAGILHRDLKPSNVFLVADEPFPQVKLLDFGIANSLQQMRNNRLTSTGTIIGTPAYLAPEQLKERELQTPATDLYALGVLWFEALTGKHPFGEGSNIELFFKILQETPPLLGSLRPAFRETPLEQLLAQLASKDPEDRPSSASVLWNEFAIACQFAEDPLEQEERYPKILAPA